MSDDNVPKLRLKPKLGPEPTPTSPAADTTPTSPAEPVSTTPAEEPKAFRLKPKLSPAPVQETAPAPVEEKPATAPAAPAAEPVRLKPQLSNPPQEAAAAPQNIEPTPEPAPEVTNPVVKLGLKPKTAVEVQPASNPAPVVGDMPPPPSTRSKPPMPVPGVDRGETGEPAEITAIHKASGMPFPPPTASGSFPPPPGAKKGLKPSGADKSKAGAAGKGSKKKLLIMVGGGILALAVLGGAFVVYQSMAEVPTPPPRLTVTAKPAAPVVVAPPSEPVVAAPVNEVVVAETPPAEVTETVPVEPVVPEVVQPAAPPPPPVASVAFRGWVENLKISGVRSGEDPRIFVGGSSYQRGDLVNPQLGVIFEDYDDATRMLVFKDQSGARVERRN